MKALAGISLCSAFALCCALTIVAQKDDDWAKMSDSKSRSSQEKQFKHKEKIEATYDKFKDRTTLVLEYMEVGGGDLVWMGAVAFASGRAYPSASDPVFLGFSLHNERWRCLDGCEVVFLVNGERLRLGVAENMDREILAGRYGAVERVGVAVPFEVFKKIAFADRVEFQIGTDEGFLKAEQFAALRDFASRIRT
jgi:hypothetical protein